jgi:indole-3-glycerol phosphate synthase
MRVLVHFVLTDGKYFGGSLDDLLLQGLGKHSAIAKRVCVDEYLEAKAYGADLICLLRRFNS